MWPCTRAGLVAPLVLDGAINGAAFLADIEPFLTPTLAKDDVVVLDNLGSHKVKGVREAVEARGASLLYLLRDAGARSKPALWKLFKRLLTQFSPDECAGYIRQGRPGRRAHDPAHHQQAAVSPRPTPELAPVLAGARPEELHSGRSSQKRRRIKPAHDPARSSAALAAGFRSSPGSGKKSKTP